LKKARRQSGGGLKLSGFFLAPAFLNSGQTGLIGFKAFLTFNIYNVKFFQNDKWVFCLMDRMRVKSVIVTTQLHNCVLLCTQYYKSSPAFLNKIITVL